MRPPWCSSATPRADEAHSNQFPVGRRPVGGRHYLWLQLLSRERTGVRDHSCDRAGSRVPSSPDPNTALKRPQVRSAMNLTLQSRFRFASISSSSRKLVRGPVARRRHFTVRAARSTRAGVSTAVLRTPCYVIVYAARLQWRDEQRLRSSARSRSGHEEGRGKSRTGTAAMDPARFGVARTFVRAPSGIPAAKAKSGLVLQPSANRQSSRQAILFPLAGRSDCEADIKPQEQDATGPSFPSRARALP